MLCQLGLSVIAHLFKDFAIFVSFPCKKRYVELQCIYYASVPPKQLIMGGGLNEEYIYALYMKYSAAML
jgi:hypothetical protein